MAKRQIDICIISDVHLGTYGCHATELLDYLKSIQPKLLILNGDIIDAWNFKKNYFPKSHIEVVRKLLKMVEKGTKVVYITGNHDEMMRKYSEFTLGKFHLVDKYIFSVKMETYWVFHGDIFDATTKGYSKLLARLGGKGYDMLILLNRLVNWFLEKMGKEKLSFSKKIKNGVKKAVSYIKDFEQTAIDLAIEQGYQYVICGHIHKPTIKHVQNEKGKVTYMNSGDWVENLTALEYFQNKWSIYTHEVNKEVDDVKAEINRQGVEEILGVKA